MREAIDGRAYHGSVANRCFVIRLFRANLAKTLIADEPILHVWIHTDHDLVDLTLTTKLHAPHSTVTITTSETIHTNKKHPFFTEEQGFLPVAQLKLGMHVLRADGRYGVITGYKLVPGAKVMYNLEVAQDHTFTVGVGQFVVHNSDTCGIDEQSSNDQPVDSAVERLNEVSPTIDRIQGGEKFPHRNDGTTFQNREGRLPQPEQPTLIGGYYTEYVVPTPGVNGPGAQRLIFGAGGEIYYTGDHCLTFEQLT